jgi:prepilin-type N-terminal cleavage/methylation domain-containing protein
VFEKCETGYIKYRFQISVFATMGAARTGDRREIRKQLFTMFCFRDLRITTANHNNGQALISKAKGKEVKMKAINYPKYVRGGAGSRDKLKAKRAGFTLVEVIVVLVIIAILAAIAVPALTGYIDKANDKTSIADARNHAVAVRTLISDAYGTGEFNRVKANLQGDMDALISNGDTAFGSGIKTYSLGALGFCSDEDPEKYYNQISDLIGESYRADENGLPAEGYWDITLVGPGDSTLYTADGFVYACFPRGLLPGETVYVVTYKMENPSLGSSDITLTEYDGAVEDFAYKENAGYTVYKCEIDIDI